MDRATIGGTCGGTVWKKEIALMGMEKSLVLLLSSASALLRRDSRARPEDVKTGHINCGLLSVKRENIR